MKKNRTKILVSGSLVYDRIMDFPGKFADHIMPDKIHILNVAFAVNSLKESFGGTAGNIAYNLALLGERPTILSTAGYDFWSYKKWLLKNKIDCSQIKIVKNKSTASCYITTDKADNQITAFHGAAMYYNNVIASGAVSAKRGDLGRARLTGLLRRPRRAPRNDIKNPPNPLYQGGILAIISPGNIKDMENYTDVYKKNGIKYIFDPGQAITSLKADVLRRSVNGAEVLIGNDYEISLVAKKTGWTINDLIAKVNMLIITKGDKGSLLYNKKNKIKVKAAKPKRVVDPTGAGDAYRAGLIKGIIEGWPVEKCGKLASAVASFAVERVGTQNHKFKWKDVVRIYKDNYEDI